MNWFSNGQRIDLLDQHNDKVYTAALSLVNGLSELVETYQPKIKGEEKTLMMEFVLHALAEHSLLNKNKLAEGIGFSDLFGALLNQNLSKDNSENA